MVRYLDAGSRNYVLCDESGEEHWTNPSCWYFGMGVVDHMLYFNEYATCSSWFSNEEVIDPVILDPIEPQMMTTIDGVDLFDRDIFEHDDDYVVQVTTNTNGSETVVNAESESLAGCDQVNGAILEKIQWTVFGTLVIGWILAMTFCICWCKTQRELSRMTECGRKVDSDITSVSI